MHLYVILLLKKYFSMPLAVSNIVALGTLVAAVGSVASGDFTTARYTSGTSYELEISHMPDFDQVRTGLPDDSGGDPGGQYCVPSSAANLCAYIANHGFTNVSPGQANWQASANFTAATSFIEDLGDRMSTSATSGTSMSTATSVIWWQLGAEALLSFTVVNEYLTNTNVVSLKEMTKYSINYNAIQVLGYGHYDYVGTNSDGETVISRDGGHAMGLVGAQRSGSTREVTYADPDDGGSQSSQSTFNYPTSSAPWVDDLVVWDTVSGSTARTNQSMNDIQRSSSADYSLLDCRMAVCPSIFASWGSFDDGLLPSLTLRTTAGTYQPGVIISRNTLLPMTPGAGTVAMSPNGAIFFLSNGQLFAEHITDSGRAVLPVALSGIDLPSISAIAFCNDRTLVAVAGQQLYAIAELDAGLPDVDDNQPFVAWQSQLPFTGAQVVTSFKGQNDGGGHSVLVFSPNRRSIFELSGDPQAPPITRSVPAQLPLDQALLAKTIIVQDRLGGLWFAQPGSSTVSVLRPNDTFVSMTLPVTNLNAMSIDDKDQLLIGDQGIIRVFRPTPKGLVEVGAQGSPFAGQRVGDGFIIARSSTNYESRFHSGPKWRNVRPPQPVRLGDIDGNGVVDGADLANLLTAWGTFTQGGADLNGDTQVTGADLSILLSNWGSSGD